MIINRKHSGGSSVKKWIELFCRKHPYFGIPNLMKYITIANAVLWLLNAVNSRILPYMVFSPYWILRGQVWRLISFIFIPPSTGILAFIAFYFYYFLGSTLEQQWGTARFNLYFFSGVVLTILFGFLIYWITGVSVSLTAYYLFLSMFFSFAVLFPDMQVLLFFVIPVKMKWLAILYALLYIAVFIGSGLLLGRWMPASLLVIPLQYILTAVIGSIPCVALIFVFKQHKAYVVGAYIWLAVLMLLMIPATLLISDWKEGYGWTDMWMFCIYLFFPAILSIGLGGTSAYLLYRKHVLDEEAKVEAKNRPSYYNT